MYLKAKSNEHLVRLMTSWSLIEALDGEYEICKKWMTEAQKYGSHIDTWEDSKERQWITKNTAAIELFLKAQNVAETNRQNAKEICMEVLDNHEEGDLIQTGDCFALLVQVESDSMRAFRFMEEMKERGLTIEDYIEEDTIKEIYRTTGKIWKENNDSEESKDDSKEDVMAY